MREILFRGKGTCGLNAGDWIYGYYVKDFWKPTRCGCGIIPIDKERGGYCEVNPSTIGQYTGLTDKNGKKIFEGDIVNVNTKKDETHNMYKGRHLVIRFDEYHRFVASGRLEYPLCNHYEWEAISNIHDNPELLKGDKDNG